jgi:3' terminal RNA ribose 2'-O-methyltransferase Hen1
MYLSIATTHRPATDLGFLIGKNPARAHDTALSFGRALVVYPQADEERCEVALVLDVDPVKLVRNRDAKTVAEYVNDRPYVASSFLSVAINRALGSAMRGASRERPELAEQAIPLEVTVGPVPMRFDPDLPRRLFEPLGWAVRTEASPEGRYAVLHLSGEARLSDLLTQLYVLIPALDREKHYWVGPEEVEKLLAKGGDWLPAHPEREAIVSGYLEGRRSLVSDALERLRDSDTAALDEDETADLEVARERPIRLYERRYDAVLSVLTELGAAKVADLGCAEGKLTERLARAPDLHEVLAMDTSGAALARAEGRLERLPEAQSGKVRLVHGALGYRDRRLDSMDACLLIEVVEHIDPERLPLAMRALFASRPRAVVITTPNREHNPVLGLGETELRHPDHRFEWSRPEFEAWAHALGMQEGYTVTFRPVGDVDPDRGPPTQMAVLTAMEARP